ncbi:MAG: thioredoxin domain-containing protein [Methanomicrobiales archaeon]|nr:thioredoxin domain-containing protein [Methanomicrobiales archaeon]
MNRLAGEKSLYLRLHGGNPVDWYPWGSEAFERARREDRPIFLSIGYSTCHWCHVMARESFEDAGIAALLNETFVSIKVDREERPDIDQVYISAALAMTGTAGWPLTILMTAEGVPFMAATYLPPDSRRGLTGMRDLIPWVGRLWKTRREELVQAGTDLFRVLGAHPVSGPAGLPESTLLERAVRDLSLAFDPVHGGFGSAPKFPSPHLPVFLLRYWHRTGEGEALRMALATLRAMARGGVHDHLGGGFHRYATDREWRIPHFEKMLYDQALLAEAYTEAFLATGAPLYRQVAETTLGYVLRDLTLPGGGFAAAEDAETGGIEGGYYLWRWDALRTLLSREELAALRKGFSVAPEGNFPGEPGGNILYRRGGADSTPPAGEEPVPGPDPALSRALDVLREARGRRPRPRRDGKVLTDWNGLAIGALSMASRAFDEPVYARAAETASSFLLAHLRREDGRLLHRWADGEAAVAGLLDDYAFLLHGLVELYMTTFSPQCLEAALPLAQVLGDRFVDRESGGLFLTPDDGEALVTRPKVVHDAAILSGNAVAARELIRLSRLTGDPAWEGLGTSLLSALRREMEASPSACTGLLMALEMAIFPSSGVVIAGDSGQPDTAALLRVLRTAYLPSTTVALAPGAGDASALAAPAPSTPMYRRVDGKATAYVCTGSTCQAPVTGPDALAALLGIPPPSRKP